MKTKRFNTTEEAESYFAEAISDGTIDGFEYIKSLSEPDYIYMWKRGCTGERYVEPRIRLIKYNERKKCVQVWEDTESHSRNAIILWA